MGLAMTVENQLEFLRLLQLADTALPIGATAQSFGLETLVAEGLLSVPDLSVFLQDYVATVGKQEGLFCRAAFRLSLVPAQTEFEEKWLNLNMRCSALKPARESRKAGGILGKRLLQLVLALEENDRLASALGTALKQDADTHHATAFGLVGGVLHFNEEITVLAYLQQNLSGLVSACQRLLPLGQKQATQLLWALKPALLSSAQQSRGADLEGEAGYIFAHLIDMAAIRHSQLATRLFIS